MELDEVPAVESQHGSPFGMSEGQDRVVGDSLLGLSCFMGSPYVVAQLLQCLDDRPREVFVGVEPGHGSSALVVADLPVDLVAMRANVGPGVHEILGPEGRVGA